MPSLFLAYLQHVIVEGSAPDFVAMAQMLAEQIPGGGLEMVPGCGHLGRLEQP
ncbi:MAG TPA: hypothetical protein VMT45_09425 [Thermoanaerobaculaceae bacterium]|nr:hypothetical protein [Thermoanaerobaculaceae bacterium]